jgi:PAS domain S-box-containing protein
MKFFYETSKHEKKRKAKAQNIAQRLKQVEDALFIIKKAAESAPEAIVLADAEGKHIFHNEAMTQLVGYTTQDLQGVEKALEIYANKDAARIVYDAIESQGSWTGEIELTSRHGNVSVALLRADAIRDHSGRIIAIIGLYTDITERKREEERARLRATAWLSERVPEFGALPQSDKEAIHDFCILYSFFEGTKLDNKPAVSEIKKYVESIKCDGSLYQFNIASYIRYLRSRYPEDDKFIELYNILKTENIKSAMEYVENMLQGSSLSIEDELIGCLIVICGLRNNLFHGDKWQHRLQEQYDNFTRANKLLMELIG